MVGDELSVVGVYCGGGWDGVGVWVYCVIVKRFGGICLGLD